MAEQRWVVPGPARVGWWLAAGVLIMAGCGSAASDAATVAPPVESGTSKDTVPETTTTQSDSGTQSESGTQTESDTQTESGNPETETTIEEVFPDVLGVELSPGADGQWTVSATIASPYDTPSRYADAFRVVAPDGTVLGERVLAHDHAAEQPFTRSLAGVEIPEGVSSVLVEARDQLSGYGGATQTVPIPPS